MEYTTTNEFTNDLNLLIFLSIDYLMEWDGAFILSGSWVVLGEIDELFV